MLRIGGRFVVNFSYLLRVGFLFFLLLVFAIFHFVVVEGVGDGVVVLLTFVLVLVLVLIVHGVASEVEVLGAAPAADRKGWRRVLGSLGERAATSVATSL